MLDHLNNTFFVIYSMMFFDYNRSYDLVGLSSTSKFVRRVIYAEQIEPGPEDILKTIATFLDRWPVI